MFIIAILIIASIVAIVCHDDVQSFAQPKKGFESKKEPYYTYIYILYVRVSACAFNLKKQNGIILT